MILEIDSGDHRAQIEITASAGVRTVTVDGVEVAHDWALLPNGHGSLIIDGVVYDLILEFSEGACCVTGRSGSQSLRVVDARRLSPQREVEEGRSGLQRLKADMPGKVIRVLVGEGDSVEYDQDLLVLEAMKMQNGIRAPKSGIVREVRVTAGMTVNTGEFLLSLE